MVVIPITGVKGCVCYAGVMLKDNSFWQISLRPGVSFYRGGASGLAIALFHASPAWAYVDPTAAGTVIQSMYVLVMSVVVAVTLIPEKLASAVRKVLHFFRADRSETPVSDEESRSDRG